MSSKQDLKEFVGSALSAGQSRPDIKAALTQAGWSADEVNDALSAWSDVAFSQPVPSPQSVVSARDFFVHGLTFALLFGAAIYLNWLCFSIIDLVLADDHLPRWTVRSIRNAIAGLIATAPLFAYLTYREGQLQAANPGRSRSVIRNWLTYLTLLATALTFLGNFGWTLAQFLNGELTDVTILRTLVVAVISGSIFLFYRRQVGKGMS